MANIISEKKKALLARKDQLLKDIQYYEKRIEDFQAKRSNSSSRYEEDYSSDSDTDCAPKGPPSVQLRLDVSRLQTSLLATQELTSVVVLEEEINVMVQDPEIIDEPPVTSPGTWREVLAECRADRVPFSLSFHVHAPNIKFGAPSYRNLRVSIVKPAHEAELANSVLTHTKTPSDAVEVLRSYSVAHRSRRTTLAHLADKYNDLLLMEPEPSGGYSIKCSTLLEVSWRLQNKVASNAPFLHRMKFELDYMEESYIKTITQYHRQLSSPTLHTDERTALLCRIIDTCLMAKEPSHIESDIENEKIKKRRATLDKDLTENEPTRKRSGESLLSPKKRDFIPQNINDDLMPPPKRSRDDPRAKNDEISPKNNKNDFMPPPKRTKNDMPPPKKNKNDGNPMQKKNKENVVPKRSNNDVISTNNDTEVMPPPKSKDEAPKKKVKNLMPPTKDVNPPKNVKDKKNINNDDIMPPSTKSKDMPNSKDNKDVMLSQQTKENVKKDKDLPKNKDDIIPPQKKENAVIQSKKSKADKNPSKNKEDKTNQNGVMPQKKKEVMPVVKKSKETNNKKEEIHEKKVKDGAMAPPKTLPKKNKLTSNLKNTQNIGKAVQKPIITKAPNKMSSITKISQNNKIGDAAQKPITKIPRLLKKSSIK